MRCEDIGRARLDRELGLIDREAETAMNRHLDTCARCRASVSIEAAVTDGLARLAALEPPPVDVHDRVIAAIAALGSPSRAPVPAADLAWAFAVAIGTAVALVGGTVAALPALFGAWKLLRIAGLGATRAVASIARTGVSVVEPLSEPLTRMLRSAHENFDGTGGIVSAQVATLTAFAVALVLCTWLVGRDLRRSSPSATEER